MVLNPGHPLYTTINKVRSDFHRRVYHSFPTYLLARWLSVLLPCLLSRSFSASPLLPSGTLQYLLKTKAISHTEVPLFFRLFHSGDVHSFRKSRVWCLQLLYRSLQSIHEHNALARKHVYSVLMGFHDSIISDGMTRALAVKILARAASLRSHAIPRTALADQEGCVRAYSWHLLLAD